MTEQFQLFRQQGAPVRLTDPLTSHDAADKVRVSRVKRLVLMALRVWGSACHEQIYADLERNGYRTSPSGVRTRCKELVEWGWVEDTGRTVTLASGNKSMVWQLTKGGRNASRTF